MNREIEVYIDLEGQAHLVGRLWARSQKGREGASFEYNPDWLRSPLRFPLEPALTLSTGAHHTREAQSIFGAFGDSAPDRWGRMLIKRMQRKLAESQNTTPRSLMEIDHLLQVDDEARLGALRFKEPSNSVFLAHSEQKIPPLIFLPKLLSASHRVLGDKDSEEDLRLLLAPGSSLGGARPKAVIRDTDGSLMLAKFPHNTDDYDVQSWSYLTLKLAEEAGVTVPPCRLVQVKKEPVLLVSRFDRRGAKRIPFLSAMSILGAADGDSRSYLELADAIRRYGSQSNADLKELWHRVLFTVLVSNFDDHLRNHGFLYDPIKQGWRLSPAYDINPVPHDVKPAFLCTCINQSDNAADLSLVMSTAEYFGLNAADAKQILGRTVSAVSRWRELASKLRISRKEIDRMASAFEHKAMGNARTSL